MEFKMKLGDLVWCINPDTGFRSVGVVRRITNHYTYVYTFIDKRTGGWTRGNAFPVKDWKYF
jgi:hypothetical protein